jgi:hypothetical protein
VVTLSAVTDSTWPELRSDNLAERSGRSGRHKQYLPSEQVVKELTSLGPDLSKLAEELRARLSDAPTDSRQ